MICFQINALSQQDGEFQRAKAIIMNNIDSLYLRTDTLIFYNNSIIVNSYEDSTGIIYSTHNYQTIKDQFPSKSVIIPKSKKYLIYNFLHCSNEDLIKSDNCLFKVSLYLREDLIYCANFYNEKLKFIIKYEKGDKYWHEYYFVTSEGFSLKNIDYWINDIEYLERHSFVNIDSRSKGLSNEDILFNVFR